MLASSTSDSSLFLALTTGPQLATQVLNQTHQILPWWAAIPCVTLAARALLLPLSLRARKAMAHIPIYRESLSRSASIREEAIKSKGLDKAHLPSLLLLARIIYRYELKKASIPSFNWAIANGAAQSLTFISLASALRHMSTNLWPGLASEGLMGLNDITLPPISFSPALTAPHGTMGALIPLGLVLAYTKAAENSPASRVSGIANVLKVSTLPFYLVSLVQPHSVLINWVSTISSTLLLQHFVHQIPFKSTQEGDGGGEVSKDLFDAIILDKRLSSEFIAYIQKADSLNVRI